MPIGTTPTVNPPEVVVNVQDDGGGDTDHKVHVQFRWSPRELAFKLLSHKPKTSFKHDKPVGWCRWANVFVPSAGKDFACKFKHKKPVTAVVEYRAEDVDTGYVSTGSVHLPPPPPSGRKKATRKA